MVNLKDVKATLAAATRAAVSEINEGRAKLEAKSKELAAVETARLPLKEAKLNAEAFVTATGDSWLKRFGGLLLSGPTGGRALADPKPGRPGVFHEATEDLWGLTCASDPARATAMLSTVLERLAYTEGPAAADRPAAAARLKKEIAALEAEDVRRTDEAIDAGLSVTHRPAVIEARAEERRRAERNSYDDRLRAERERAIDAAAAQ